MDAGGDKSVCSDEILSILAEYGGQISSYSETGGEFYSSDCGSNHNNDIAFSEATESEIGFEVEDERTAGFQWENKDNYVGQR
jgi:hypothetical protein